LSCFIAMFAVIKASCHHGSKVAPLVWCMHTYIQL
jgi:hypothetical protein